MINTNNSNDGSVSDPTETGSSLQAKALERALSGAKPRTLTPWEWQEWESIQAAQKAADTGEN